MGRARALAERLDLDTGRRIDELSSGNAKKVALVQSMLHSPRLLILDEPTSGLDPLMQNMLGEILREENSRGATVFFSSHVLSEVERLCRRVAILKEGSIVADEDISTLGQKQLRKVSFTCSRNIESSHFSAGKAIEFVRNGEEVSFLYAGDSNSLVRSLGGLDVHRLRIEEPTLEEVFMHYYRGTPSRGGGPGFEGEASR
jgi:ABC-2 type transport system ATP-binding protein